MVATVNISPQNSASHNMFFSHYVTDLVEFVLFVKERDINRAMSDNVNMEISCFSSNLNPDHLMFIYM